MVKTWKSLIVISFASAALLACAGFLAVYLWRQHLEHLRDGPLVAHQTTPLSPSAIQQSVGPLRDGPHTAYPAAALSSSARQQFLEGNFRIIKSVEGLPLAVLRAFTEEGGSRFLMANPGKEFLSTDVIYDSSLPQKRLIFAGVLEDKCFVYYEQGGLGRADILAFFRLNSKESMEPLWRGYCRGAADIQDLRALVLKNKCFPVPQNMN